MNTTAVLNLKFSDLNAVLQTATEEQCKKLLEEEKKKRNRYSYLVRIYGRYNTLRCQRERSELMEAISG